MTRPSQAAALTINAAAAAVPERSASRFPTFSHEYPSSLHGVAESAKQAEPFQEQTVESKRNPRLATSVQSSPQLIIGSKTNPSLATYQEPIIESKRNTRLEIPAPTSTRPAQHQHTAPTLSDEAKNARCAAASEPPADPVVSSSAIQSARQGGGPGDGGQILDECRKAQYASDDPAADSTTEMSHDQATETATDETEAWPFVYSEADPDFCYVIRQLIVVDDFQSQKVRPGERRACEGPGIYYNRTAQKALQWMEFALQDTEYQQAMTEFQRLNIVQPAGRSEDSAVTAESKSDTTDTKTFAEQSKSRATLAWADDTKSRMTLAETAQTLHGYGGSGDGDGDEWTEFQSARNSKGEVELATLGGGVDEKNTPRQDDEPEAKAASLLPSGMKPSEQAAIERLQMLLCGRRLGRVTA